MTPPKKSATPKRAVSDEGRPERFFDQYVWHHKVHEDIGEKLRYFLLKVSPYDEANLRDSLERLVKEKSISGLRAYRVFGQNDLMIRAWMDDTTYHAMRTLFHKHIDEGKVRLEEVLPDYIERVEYRWYWEKTPPTNPTLRSDAKLVMDLMLDHAVVVRVESGEGRDLEGGLFKRYEEDGLVVHKPGTVDTITFFICVEVDGAPIGSKDRGKLVNSVKDYISRRKKYWYPEIDSATGVIGHLIIRARVRARNYFAIGVLTKWLSGQSHVCGTETYLSLTPRPLVGETSLAILLATDEKPDPRVVVVFKEPGYPHGPYPPRMWGGGIGDEVVMYLKGKNLNPPEGLRTFLHDFLLGVLKRNPTDMVGALHTIFHQLEGYLNRRKREYIQLIGLEFDAIFVECFPPNTKRKVDELTLADLFVVYYKAMSKARRELTSPRGWDTLVEVRNWEAHGKGYRWDEEVRSWEEKVRDSEARGKSYKWEGAKDQWKRLADSMILFWPEIASLYREVRSVCKSREGLPRLFPE